MSDRDAETWQIYPRIRGADCFYEEWNITTILQSHLTLSEQDTGITLSTGHGILLLHCNASCNHRVYFPVPQFNEKSVHKAHADLTIIPTDGKENKLGCG